MKLKKRPQPCNDIDFIPQNHPKASGYQLTLGDFGLALGTFDMTLHLSLSAFDLVLSILMRLSQI